MTSASVSLAPDALEEMVRELERLKAILEAHAVGGATPPPPARRAAPVARLARQFELTPFETDVLLLAAACELDAAFPALCAAAAGTPDVQGPTFSLCLAALPGAHWSATGPGAPLRRWRLVELAAGASPTRAILRIDERILHELTATATLDERLRGACTHVPATEQLVASHEQIVDRIVQAWERASPPFPVIQLVGQDAVDKRAIAARACAEAGLVLLEMKASAVPAAPEAMETMATLWRREAALAHAALLLDADDHDAVSPEAAAAVRFLERIGGVALLAAREPLRARERAFATFDVARPTSPEQMRVWADALGARAQALGERLEGIVAQFDLPEREIRHAAQAALVSCRDEASPAEIGARLWQECRVRARARLDDLAQRLETRAGWDDLILPATEVRVLHEIVAQVRHRHHVYARWGFGRHSTRGLGIAALFAGDSGTGKTLAAEVLARELELDLYRVDLSQVVSKYVGETEKNVRRIFDAAESGAALLLFDEADALFGKRSDVKDSHDRFANMEVSYLLQRMESYRGLAVLTTNLKDALDPAFLRRLRFVVRFPFPEAATRQEIWRRAIPRDAPTEGLDHARLARLPVPGGAIRNIAMCGAFLAAAEGRPLRMEHLARAARREFMKLDKPILESELEAWR